MHRLFQIVFGIFICIYGTLASAAPSREILDIYTKGLYHFAPYCFELVSGDVSEREAKLIEFWEGADGDAPADDDEMFKRVSVFASSEIWRSSYDPEIKTTDVADYYGEQKERFSTPDWFVGGRFLIPHELVDAIDPEEWKTELENVNSADDFRSVASKFYRSIGVTGDGWLDKIDRGAIGDEVFDLFFAQPVKEATGPLDSKNGIMFVWVEEKGSSGVAPLAMVENTLRNELVEKLREEQIARMIEQAGGELHEEEIVSTDWNEDTVVYTIGGTPRTLAQARSFVFSFIGEASNPEYRRKAARRALENESIYTAGAGDDKTVEVWAPEMARRLYTLNSLQNTVRDRYLERVGKVELQELKNHYEENKQTVFATPQSYKLVLFLMARNPDRLEGGKAQALASIEAWKSMEKVHERVAGMNKVEEMLALSGEKIKGLRINNMTAQGNPLSDFPAEFSSAIQEANPGEVSELIITSGSYAFFYLQEIEDPKPIPYTDAFDNVQVHYNKVLMMQIASDVLSKKKP